MDDNSLIKDIGRSYIVSSLLPAGLFVSLGCLLYKSFLFLDFLSLNSNDPLAALPWIALSGFIVWVAFVLYSKVDATIQFFEGYKLPSWLQVLLIRLFILRDYRRMTKNIRESKRLLQYRPKEFSPEETRILLQAQADYFGVETSSPLREADLLPTKLGNILRASELYSEERFGFNGLVFWTRLSNILPQAARNTLDEKFSQLIFLLNSSLLCYYNGIIALVIWGAYRLWIQFPIIGQKVNDWGIQNLIKDGFDKPFSSNTYLLFGFIWFISGYALYRSSISVAETFGLLIRSNFDLYRFDLLKQLNHPIPQSLNQERELWSKLNEFIINGGNLGNTPLDDFNYVLRPDLA